MAGPLFLVLGLTGAVLVFAPEIEEAARRPGEPVRAGGARASLDAIVAAARIGHQGGEPRALHFPDHPEHPYRVELAFGDRRLDVAVDPYAARVLGHYAPDRSLLIPLRALHVGLHAGPTGAVVVALLGLVLVAGGMSGLWLYGPSLRRRPPARMLHRALGGATLALAVIVGLSGALLGATGVVAATTVTPPAPPRGVLSRLDAVVARAETALPGGRISALVAAAGTTIRVEKRERGGAVLVDRESGRIIEVRTVARSSGIQGVLGRLHSGDFAGWVSRVAYAGVGLAIPILSISGYFIAARREAR